MKKVFEMILIALIITASAIGLSVAAIRHYSNQITEEKNAPELVAQDYTFELKGTSFSISIPEIWGDYKFTLKEPLRRFSKTDHGRLTFTRNGTLTYTPDKDFEGTDSFKYCICTTPDHCSNFATITIKVISQHSASYSKPAEIKVGRPNGFPPPPPEVTDHGGIKIVRPNYFVR